MERIKNNYFLRFIVRVFRGGSWCKKQYEGIKNLDETKLELIILRENQRSDELKIAQTEDSITMLGNRMKELKNKIYELKSNSGKIPRPIKNRREKY